VLLDGNGSVLGIVTARTDGDDAARYATPFDYARQVYRQLMDSGEINTADLAVAVEELDDATADALNVSGGVVVSPVAAPAPDGLETGDVITAINGADVNDLNDSVTEVRRYQPGDEVDIAVVRDGAPVTVVTRLRGAPGVP
jgi:serine protease Do